MKKQASKVAHNRPRPSYFTVPPRSTAHSQELIFHIMKSREETSVLLSVTRMFLVTVYQISNQTQTRFCTFDIDLDGLNCRSWFWIFQFEFAASIRQELWLFFSIFCILLIEDQSNFITELKKQRFNRNMKRITSGPWTIVSILRRSWVRPTVANLCNIRI